MYVISVRNKGSKMILYFALIVVVFIEVGLFLYNRKPKKA